MTILAPGQDWHWIVRPAGVSVYAVLPKTRRQFHVPDVAELFLWATELMDTADQLANPVARSLQFRDGLFMALLASCGRRLRAMSSLRVGHELVRAGQRYRIEIPPELDKTHRYDAFDVRDSLTSYMDRYLREIRPALLAANQSDWLWINSAGGRLSGKTLQHHVFRRTKQWFGHGAGPHKFKYAVATACALHAPEVPGLAGSVLRTSAKVLEMHYIRANQVRAARAFERVLKDRQSR